MSVRKQQSQDSRKNINSTVLKKLSTRCSNQELMLDSFTIFQWRLPAFVTAELTLAKLNFGLKISS